MNQISPNKEFILTWSGADPADTDVLYVQAIIRNAKTLAILQTVNLIDRGNHFFSAPYITPTDPNQLGTGLQIVIVYSIYTDAGYTIPSQNYSRESHDYLVKQFIDASQFWGAGGSTFDPKELKKAVSEALSELKFPEPIKQEFPIKELVALIKTELDKLPHELPEEKETDLKPIISSIEDVRRAINILPTLARPTDLKPLQTKISEIESSLTEIVDGIGETLTAELKKIEQTALKENEKMVNTMIQTILTTIEDKIKDGSFRMSVFGDKDPFDKTDEKKKNYLNSLKNRYAIK